MEVRQSALEGLEMIDKRFWENRRVFLTGHTGFKGAWLSLWLYLLGAKVTGYALEPPTRPSLFILSKIDRLLRSIIADVRDGKSLKKAMLAVKPEIVIHMAAQPIVRESYTVPVDTFFVNVMGTVNVLEAARGCKSVKAVINVTTDKVYEDSNANYVTRNAYKESAPLGGHDPYSGSKACSELVAQAYRRSYKLNVATARAGNVIGGGDWADDRLVPDFVRALLKGKKMRVRNPKAVRPWQHVLEPLAGYLLLAEELLKHGQKYAEAWNFGPDESDAKAVEWLVRKLCVAWGEGAGYAVAHGKHPHEAHYLKLDSTKARKRLGWRPKYDLTKAVDKTVEWTRAYQKKADPRKVCIQQIKDYMS